MTTRWEPGQLITRREILGFEPTNTVDRSAPWFDQCWLELPVIVVADDDDQLVLYVAKRTPLTFPAGDWPIAGGDHPWIAHEHWQGEGCLMTHRRGEHHSIWHFWDGPNRTFRGWYINVQTEYRRTPNAFETADLELDFVVAPDGSWEVKDWDEVDVRVQEGRFSAKLSSWIRAYGTNIMARLEAEGPWWDQSWAKWSPPPGWDRA